MKFIHVEKNGKQHYIIEFTNEDLEGLAIKRTMSTPEPIAGSYFTFVLMHDKDELDRFNEELLSGIEQEVRDES